VSRIVIVDDHPGFCERLETYIREQDGCSVAGTAVDAPSGLRMVRATRPDLVLIDIGLPGENGLQLASRLAGMDLGVRVVLMGENETAEYNRAAVIAGAVAYVSKTEIGRDLPKLLRCRAGGRPSQERPTAVGSPDDVIARTALALGTSTRPAAWDWSVPRFAEWEAAFASTALLGGIVLGRPAPALAGVVGFLFLSYRQLTLPRVHRGHGGSEACTGCGAPVEQSSIVGRPRLTREEPARRTGHGAVREVRPARGR
jgi:CheY-like chemotaxis protein